MNHYFMCISLKVSRTAIRNILCWALFLPVCQVYAQNDVLGGQDTLVLENDRIEDVIDSEKPLLRTPKADIPPPSVNRFTYEPLDVFMETDYTPRPPQVQPLEPPGREKLYHNMLKLQFGRYVTPHATLYLNNGPDRNNDLGLQFTHESSHNDEVTYRRYREDYGTIYGSTQSGDKEYKGSLSIYNTQYFNFVDPIAAGIENLRDEVREPIEDSIRMSFTRLDLKGSLQSLQNDKKTYFYNLDGRVRYYNGKRENSELHLTLNPSGGVEITDDLILDADLGFTYTRADIGLSVQDRTFFTAIPSLNFSSGNFKGKVGLVYNAYNNDVDTASISNLGPIAELSYSLAEGFTLMAGVSSGMKYNHYFDMIYTNRYLSRDVEIRPTIEKFQVYGGIKGKVANSIDYSAKVYFKRLENALVFTVPFDQAYFQASYDSLVEVLGITGEIKYQLDEAISLGGNLTYENFTMSQLAKYFHVAPFRADAFVRYNWKDKLLAQASLGFFSNTPMGLDENGNEFTRDALPLLNLHAEYKVLERFYVHLAVDNILDFSYQRWLFYPERNFDIKGGVSIIF